MQPDPFFDEVRRRHPDVDLVVLPPVQPGSPSADPGEVVGDDIVAAQLTSVTETCADLWRRLVPHTLAAPSTRLTRAAHVDTVHVSCSVTERHEEGPALLDALRGLLELYGWQVHRPDEGLPRLHARRQELQARATYSPQSGALRLVVTGAELVVGTDRARGLVRAAAEASR